jgi:hypothetical protein
MGARRQNNFWPDAMMDMTCILLAAGWDELFKYLPIILAVLFWVISHFAGQTPKKTPQRSRPSGMPASPKEAKPANESLQSEIDEFLKQARAVREGKKAGGKVAIPPTLARDAPPKTSRPNEFPTQRPTRRPTPMLPKRAARREETKPLVRPLTAPAAVETVENRPSRESLSQHVAESLDSSKFTRRATQLSQVQQDSDTEFRQHMQRIFQHELGTLKKESAGIFEAAAATVAVATAAATAKATAAAAGAQSATAPMTIQRGSSDIALFLAGRKNMRDAVILSEILQRPEQRW